MLFQKNILKKYTDAVPQDVVAQAWQQYQSYFLNPEIQANIRQSKEEQFQEGFLRELFVKVLGYTLNPSPDYNLITEQKNETNSRKADGAILVDGKVVGIIELKDHKTTDLSKIEQQAFGYKSQNQNAVYVVISNFEKLRFYIDNAVECAEFDLFHLTENEFRTLWLCLAYENIAANLPKRIKTESVSSEDAITNALYRDYTNFKRVLYQDICANNGVADDDARVELYKKTQKLLDRMLFIFFAEDSGLLPPNTMIRIIDDWRKLADLDAYVPLYERIKKYFGYLDTGYKGKDYEIFAYNGGLFKPDEVLDSLKITDSVLEQHTRRLSEYDYQSEVDVNILGHIFENSLNEIEAVAAPTDAAPSTTKRKRDGVFYTPQYITKYIVENTVGRLCADKKAELQIDEQEYFADRRRNKDTKIKLLKRLNDYRQWLLQITICDPACGSGAFLNAALQFLIQEHRLIDEMDAKITDSPMVIPNVENSILENNLFGVDINEESVEIARLSLWLRTARPHRKLNSLNQNIKCGNSLISDPEVAADKAFDWQREFPQVFERGGFDVVIGNPPYVNMVNILDEKQRKYYQTNYKTVKNKSDLYSIFTEKSSHLLRGEGLFGFIFSNSWMGTDSFSAFREFLANDVRVTKLVQLPPDVFSDATVTTVLCFYTKTTPNENDFIDIETYIDQSFVSKGFKLSYKQIRENPNTSFSFEKTIELNKVRSVELGNIVSFSLGIKTSDDKRFIFTEKKDDDCYLFLRGRNISRWNTPQNNEWLWYKPELITQKPGGRPRIFENFTVEKKIVIQDMAFEINATIDYQKYLCNDKVNIIFETDNNYTMEYILCLLNSRLINIWFKKIYTSGLEIKINQLRTIPIPEITIDQQQPFVALADKMLTLNAELQQKVSRFLRRITETYNLEKTTAALETFYTLGFGDFVKELGKQKVKLTLVQKDELEDYFNAYQSECQSLKTAIATTDHEIDRMVYALYGLTDEEIAVIEN
ncbi:MAG: N-6 DNA methylase [Salinivirgaceae bacterium]|nr:N-6 DNA methylase [Salinivirgaceae bacterium]